MQRKELSSGQLRALLYASDVIGLTVGFAAVLLAVSFQARAGWGMLAGVSLLAAALGVLCMRSQELYLSRVNSIRTIELTRTIRALALTSGAMVVLDRVLQTGVRLRQIVAGAAVGLIVVMVGRSAFRVILQVQRRRGRYRRNVVVVGTDRYARKIVDLFRDHPETGVVVTACLGSREEAEASGIGELWAGELTEVSSIGGQAELTGVLLTPAVLELPELPFLVRDFHARGLHVQMITGQSSLHQRRVRALPVAYEPVLFIERASLRRTQRWLKRMFDIILSAVLIVLTAPVMAAVALLIRRDSPGPILFRQQRVGLHGSNFAVLKFRTMVVDAEALLAKLAATNERNGPLFKMDVDPRVTRIGHFLRLSSLDELPQLFNVLRGEMSLVGPRPALPKEVDEFSPTLRLRETVMPGITGLWQVEARDNPSFEAYHRMDLFYVDNWSLLLDLVILFGTVEQVLTRVLVRNRAEASAIDAGESTDLMSRSVA